MVGALVPVLMYIYCFRAGGCTNVGLCVTFLWNTGTLFLHLVQLLLKVGYRSYIQMCICLVSLGQVIVLSFVMPNIFTDVYIYIYLLEVRWKYI